MDMEISVCLYRNNDFDVILRDAQTGEGLMLSGNQKLTDKQRDLLFRLAPGCTWTMYEMVPHSI